MIRIATCALMLVLSTVVVRAEGSVDYLRDVRPILEANCYKCHGVDKQRGMMRLDTADLIKEGGEGGPAIVPGPGGADQSLLIQAVSGKIEDWRMPPPKEDGGGEPLTEQQIDVLRRWIEGGAIAPAEPQPAQPPKHWAYVAPQRVAPRAVSPLPKGERAENPIDAFIATKHKELGLRPNSPADKPTLLRRIYLDLIGLPPTPEQVRAFVEDTSHDAYEKVVDELLASPRYGERWGRHWMDIWRYSDWYGWQAEIRNSQRHLWRWRDWIVESLNSDKGYDRMIVEMMAGDEVAPLDPDTLRATGFLARNWFKFNRNVWLDNAVEHTAKAFLGTTMNCARCHEHKYDPISHRDYYRFRAFFEPHDVKTWRLPGQPNLEADGVACVYDAKADAPTYRLIRGNEKDPDKSRPLEPGFPKALSFDELKIAPVELPVEAYYPGRRQYVQRETLSAAESELAAADQAVVAAKAALDASHKLAQAKASATEPSTEVAVGDGATQVAPAGVEQPAASAQAEAQHQLANARRASAQARLLSIRARIVADSAVYGSSPSQELESVKLVAAAAERQAAARQAEFALAQTEYELAAAQAGLKDSDGKSQAAVTAAQAKVAEARKALEAAMTALGEHDGSYSPLTPVYPKTSTGRRLALAKWITDRRNPLTARVAVNHIWLRHFGEPLVSTVFDFGPNGARPTHPELLDDLAVRFMKEGWSMKKLHRLIALSDTYGRSSAPSNPQSTDPDNRYLWRQNVRRAEAEVVRDSVLAVSGGLDLTMGGPELDHTAAMTTHRRSLYYRTAPEKQSRFFMVFDAPSPTECYRRDESVVPQQALAMVNSALTLERARVLACEISRLVGGPEHDAAFIRATFERLLSRAATAEEEAECARFLQEQARLLASQESLTAFGGAAAVKVKPADQPHLRARENLVQVLMNHNDFVTIR